MRNLISTFMVILIANCSFALSLEYSTFLGGSSNESYSNNGITIDSNDYIYLTGATNSVDFPITSGIIDSIKNYVDVNVTCLSSNSSTLNYSTFIGGSGWEEGSNITVDSNQNAYITGYMHEIPNAPYNNDFPIINAFDNSYNGNDEIFISKISPNGSNLIFSTFFGGTNNELGSDIILDSMSDYYLTGDTQSINFPISSGAYDTNKSYTDIFVSKMNTSGNSLVFSTFIGGSDKDVGNCLDIDSNNNIYVVGFTESLNYPTQNPLYNSHGGGELDAILTKLSNNGSSLLFSSFIGGSNDENGYGIKVNSINEAYITGYTKSTDFPIFAPLNSTLNGSNDVFILALDSSCTSLKFSTFYGGSGSEGARGIDIDENDNIFILGTTSSLDLPIINAYSTSHSGGTELFLTSFSNNVDKILSSTYFGGASNEVLSQSGNPLSCQNGKLVSLCKTNSTDYPTTLGAFDSSWNIGYDYGIAVFRTEITDLKVQPIGQNIILSWEAKENSALYKIYRGESPEFSNSTQIGTVTPNGNPPTFTDIGAISSGSQYFYFVTWEN